MWGKRTVRAPRPMMAWALTTGREERSSTVNRRRMCSSHTDGLTEERGQRLTAGEGIEVDRHTHTTQRKIIEKQCSLRCSLT